MASHLSRNLLAFPRRFLPTPALSAGGSEIGSGGKVYGGFRIDLVPRKGVSNQYRLVKTKG